MRYIAVKPLLRAVSVAIFTLLALSTHSADGQTTTTLYSFTGQPAEYPQYVMVAQGRDGQLYGTTTDGGINGSIIKVSTSRIFTQLFSFDNTDGNVPGEGVTLASDGNFYGVTPDGGNSGNGVLYKINSSGSYTVIHSFTGGSDGAIPFAPPIQASDGSLYGTAEFSNAGGATVYRYTPSSANFSVIYQFSSGNIGAPLIQASDGFLYGTTGNGGWAHCGTIFKMSTTGKLLQSVPFPCKAGGASPSFGPLLQASDGNFYGTTIGGGVQNQGTVFKMTPDFQVSILYTFMGHTQSTVDGALPAAGLIQATDGNLYGATYKGGSAGLGTLFRISTSGVYEMLYSFNGATGVAPAGTLMQHTNGMLYGTAGGGGVNRLGTVYELNLGLAPFVTFVQPTGKIGQTAQIMGQGLTGTISVTFNGVAATFTVPSPTFMLATIPSGATSGPVVVTTPTATLTSNRNFNILQ
jgi:uncharacterized repeat protein (TIGR03803 family)